MDLAKHNKTISHKGSKETGILLIHGITSTTSSMMYLAEKFIQEGFHVELPSLPGHGIIWQELNKVTYQDWLDELSIRLNELQNNCKHVFVCGLSLGGALALRLTQLHPEISGMILINHACKFNHPKFWFVPFIKNLIPSTPAVASDIKDKTQQEKAYSRTPTKAVHQMLLMLKKIRKDLPQTTNPVLIFKSKNDHVVPVISAKYTMQKIGSQKKELIWLENSYHVATMDFDKDKIVEESIRFIDEITK